MEHGANLGDTVLTGASALNIARKFKHNQVIAFLDTLGAPDIADLLACRKWVFPSYFSSYLGSRATETLRALSLS